MPKTRITGQDVSDASITDADVASANKDGAAGTPSLRTLGTGAAQAAAGNDSRFAGVTPTYAYNAQLAPYSAIADAADIVSIANAGGGNITLTLSGGNYTYSAGQSLKVKGTAGGAYDGTYSIVTGGLATVVITHAFTVTSTGVVYVTDNTTAINAAITAANAASGGVVFLPNGKYAIAGVINQKTGVAIMGEGYGTTLVQVTASTNGISCAEQHRWSIRQIHLQSGVRSLATGAGEAIHVNDCKETFTDHIWIDGGPSEDQQEACRWQYGVRVNDTDQQTVYTISSVANNGGTARFLTSAPHGFTAGQHVGISGTTDYDTSITGISQVTITNVSDSTHFDTAQAFTSTKTGTVSRIGYQTRHFTMTHFWITSIGSGTNNWGLRIAAGPAGWGFLIAYGVIQTERHTVFGQTNYTTQGYGGAFFNYNDGGHFTQIEIIGFGYPVLIDGTGSHTIGMSNSKFMNVSMENASIGPAVTITGGVTGTSFWGCTFYQARVGTPINSLSIDSTQCIINLTNCYFLTNASGSCTSINLTTAATLGGVVVRMVDCDFNGGSQTCNAITMSADDAAGNSASNVILDVEHCYIHDFVSAASNGAITVNGWNDAYISVNNCNFLVAVATPIFFAQPGAALNYYAKGNQPATANRLSEMRALRTADQTLTTAVEDDILFTSVAANNGGADPDVMLPSQLSRTIASSNGIVAAASPIAEGVITTTVAHGWKVGDVIRIQNTERSTQFTANALVLTQYHAAVDTDAPDYYWHCDEASGNLASSGSAGALAAVPVSTPSYGNTGGCTADPAASNKAVGTGSGGVKIFATAASTMNNIADAFTLEFIGSKTTANPGTIYMMMSKAGAATGFEMGLDATGHLALWNNGTLAFTSTTAHLDTNSHHYVLTKSGTTVTMLVDGVAETVTTNLNYTNAAASTVFRIGADHTPANVWVGNIQHVAAYKTTILTTARALFHTRMMTNVVGVLRDTRSVAGVLVGDTILCNSLLLVVTTINGNSLEGSAGWTTNAWSGTATTGGASSLNPGDGLAWDDLITKYNNYSSRTPTWTAAGAPARLWRVTRVPSTTTAQIVDTAASTSVTTEGTSINGTAQIWHLGRARLRRLGRYLVSATVEFDADAAGTGVRQLLVRKYTKSGGLNLASAIYLQANNNRPSATAGVKEILTVTGIISVTTVGGDDYLNVSALQSSGGNLAIKTDFIYSPIFNVTYLGE